MRDTLIMIYIDYINNYLTVERYAECNGLTVQQACDLIDLARSIAHSSHPDE